jgi:hypothetical protein
VKDGDEGGSAFGGDFENVFDRQVDVTDETSDPERPELIGQQQLLLYQSLVVNLKIYFLSFKFCFFVILLMLF